MDQKSLKKFIYSQIDVDRPFLLALSGGPDSMMLYHWLKSQSIAFAVAHVDHRWRPQSGHEAQLLQEKAEKEQIPFHLKILDPNLLSGNLEDACRHERLDFFEKLCREEGYSAVILGHHQNDQAETVLKRVLEGASSLMSMQKISCYRTMKLLRPLLDIPKSALLSYLNLHNISYFLDETNLDARFLRGRMREEILPAIEKNFGKNVTASLCRIADDAAEINQYLDGKVDSYLKKVKQTSFGISLEEFPESRTEVKHLVRKFCRIGQLILSHAALECAVHHILSRSADRQISAGKFLLQLDRGRLFLPLNSCEVLEGSFSLTPGVHLIQQWRVTVSESSFIRPTNWKSLWDKGFGQVVLPANRYFLKSPSMHESYPNKSPIRDFWTKQKVPAFLRRIVPVIQGGDGVAHEFLTGRGRQIGSIDHGLMIRLEKISGSF